MTPGTAYQKNTMFDNWLRPFLIHPVNDRTINKGTAKANLLGQRYEKYFVCRMGPEFDPTETAETDIQDEMPQLVQPHSGKEDFYKGSIAAA